MANLIIPPRDLAPVAEVFDTDALVVDDGSTVGKATPKQVVDAGRAWATIGEAQAGTVPDRSMSPLTTKAAIDALASAATGATPVTSYAAAVTAGGNVARTRVAAIITGHLIEWVRETGGTCLGGGWVPANTVTPMHWGAFGDGVTDDTAAINAAFDYVRNYEDFTNTIQRPVTLDGNNCSYLTTGSINATGISSARGWKVRDFFVKSRAYNKTVLDFLGSRFATLDNVSVFGLGQSTPGDQPWAGILIGDAVGLDSAHFTMINVSCDGYFRGAGFQNYGAENVTAVRPMFWNRRVPDGSTTTTDPTFAPSYGAVLDGRAVIPVRSDFVTPGTGRTSFTMNTYVSPSIQKPFGIVGTALYVSDISSMTFIKPYITNGGGGAAIRWPLWDDYTPYSVTFDGLQVETTGNVSVFDFILPGTAGYKDVQGLSVACGNLFSSEDFIRVTGAAGAVGFKDFSLHIERWNGTTPTNGVFANKDKIGIFGGRITAPAIADLGTITSYLAFQARTYTLADNSQREYARVQFRGGAQVFDRLDLSGIPTYTSAANASAAGLVAGQVFILAATNALTKV